MSEKKVIKRAVREVWDRVKLLRADSAKLYNAQEIKSAAEALAALAAELEGLAIKTSSASAMPALDDANAAPPTQGKRKRKTKTTSDGSGE